MSGSAFDNPLIAGLPMQKDNVVKTAIKEVTGGGFFSRFRR